MAQAAPAGAGGAPVPSAPADEGMLRIRGGVGGLTFQFEELLAGAAALDGIVRQLQAVEAEADAVRRALFPYQSDSYSSGSAAITAVAEGGRSAGRVRSDLQRLGGDVRASHREYEFTESRNALLLRMGIHGAGFGPGAGILGLPPWNVRDVVQDGIGMVSSSLAMLLGRPSGPAGVPGTAGGPLDARRAVRELSTARGLEFLQPRPVRITGEEARTEAADMSPAGLLLRAEDVARTSGGIEVLRTGSGSRPAWVVIIPGTQPGLPADTNPFDPAGIVEALGHGSAETNAAVREALRRAGAEAGEDVAAVGYSQGGIHAMNLSQDRDFLAEYNLKFVLTAGSPVGGIVPAPGVSSLHLEHEHDWVPGADGLPNPDTREQVTVTLTNPLEIPPPGEAGLGPGHGLGNYVAAAGAVSASRDPSLQGATAALIAVVGTAGAARVTRFSLRRDARPLRREVMAPGPRPGPDRAPAQRPAGGPQA